MPKNTKQKPAVRVCSLCQKPGHNRARCPMAQEIRPNPPKNSVTFTIQHTQKETFHSPHIVDLQTKNLWRGVKSSEPEQDRTLYHSYHRIAPIVAAPVLNKFKTPAPTINFFAKPKDLEKEIASAYRPEPEIPPLAPARNELNELEKIAKTEPKKIKAPRVKKEFSIHWPEFHFSVRRAIVGATLVAFFIITPLKAGGYYQDIKNTTSSVAESGVQGFMALQDSTAALLQADIGGAGDATEQALFNFNSAIKQLEQNHQVLQKIASVIPIVKGEVAGRQKILTAGQKITLGNTYLLQGIKKSQENNNENLTEKINIIVEHLNAAIPNYETAIEDLNGVDAGILPLEYQAVFADFRELFKTAVNDLKTLTELGENISQIFGNDGLRRYLLVFQNPHEIRPTGGFIGSFAVIDVKNGKIEKIDLPPGGSYDLKGQLNKWVEPPTPLLLSNSRWEFQDANWFPDFGITAEKLMWFYRHSRNRTVDGVIAVNATVLERLLAIMGPIQDTKRNLTLSADNAVEAIQNVVENGPEKSDNKPKQILTDLAPEFLEFLQNMKPEQAMPILANLSEALEKKEIQAYFTDSEVDANINRMNWGGRIKETKSGGDYLMVVNANIQGQKSDALMEQTIEHQAVVSDDGSVTDTVIITRKHTGEKNDDLYNQTNVDYLRIYVPAGSQLISVNGAFWPHEKNFKVPAEWTEIDEFLKNTEQEVGFEPKSGTRITNEFGKTAFGNWLITEPGAVSQIIFTYKLPAQIISEKKSDGYSIQKMFDSKYLISDYQLTVQKQSGMESTFNSQIIYPEDWHPTWKNGSDATMASNGMSISTKLEKDLNWGLMMRKILD